MHPKVKVPAIVGVILTAILTICSVVGGLLPTYLPIATAVTTVLQAVAGELTYSTPHRRR